MEPGHSQMNEEPPLRTHFFGWFLASRELEGSSRIQQGNSQPNEIKKNENHSKIHQPLAFALRLFYTAGRTLLFCGITGASRRLPKPARRVRWAEHSGRPG